MQNDVCVWQSASHLRIGNLASKSFKLIYESARIGLRVIFADNAKEGSNRPTHKAVWRAENEPALHGWNKPRPIRHFSMAEHCTPDHYSSRVPVHSALVQKSDTAITNLAGRLSGSMLGKNHVLGKCSEAKFGYSGRVALTSVTANVIGGQSQ